MKTASKRKYELKQRAAEMAETRRRITEAAVELHGTVGPARTTMSAIAERAGVRRHTVYRHFPTDAELFEACSSHFWAVNPWPDPQRWRAIDNPHRRAAEALDELYEYYERTAPMYGNVLRDLDLVDALAPSIAAFRAYLDEAAVTLAAGRPVRGRRRRLLEAATAHAVALETWHSLAAANRLGRAEAVELAVALIEAAAGAPPARR